MINLNCFYLYAGYGNAGEQPERHMRFRKRVMPQRYRSLIYKHLNQSLSWKTKALNPGSLRAEPSITVRLN